ncbi:TonB-dependent receptor [Marinomonas sp. 5E14-1]|uniref:TonB-dependent receptor domain-containing protein n=1 Tax=Marinomonas sp. 5E14-1 TaxID=3153922 RepID=UPI0032642A58
MRSHRLFSKSVLAIAISQAALSGFAIAEESTTLNELKIEGRAITELDQEITSEDIDNSQATDLEDLFLGKSEVTAGGAIKLGQKVYVRNIGEDALNITIDGAEQAAGIFHHTGRVTIEPELLKRVEIEAGAANATSGPGALGGSIRFVTKEASDLLDDDQNIGALLKSTYSSNGEGLKNSATVYGRTESGKSEGMIHLSDSSHEDYVDGNGDELTGTELDEFLGFAKFKTQLTDEQSISVSYENAEDSGNIIYKSDQGSTDTTYFTIVERKTTTLNYDFVDADNDLIDLSVTIYNTVNDLFHDFESYGSYTGYAETSGLTLENISAADNHELTYGVNYREDESFFTNGSDDVSETSTVAGLYLQDNIDLTDQLMLSAGIRYDHYELIDNNDDQVSDGGFSPSIGATYKLNNELEFTANYAVAIRGPEVRDAYKVANGITNSEDLKAETANNIEFGVNYQKNQLSVGAGVYKSVIKDAIGTEDSAGNEVSWGNIYDNFEENIETTGFYLDVTYQLEQLTAGLHYHSADTLYGDMIVTRYTHGSTATSIGDTLALSLDYQVNSVFKAGWSAEFVKGIDNIEQSIDSTYGLYELEIDKPGYAVHNIYAQWLPLGDDQLTVSLTINNLFDKQYLSHAALEDYTDAHSEFSAIVGQAAAGRDIRLSAAYKF